MELFCKRIQRTISAQVVSCCDHNIQKIMQHLHINILNMFDYWVNRVAHLLLLKSFHWCLNTDAVVSLQTKLNWLKLHLWWQTVWPEFSHFVRSLEFFGYFLRVYLVFGKRFNIHYNFLMLWDNFSLLNWPSIWSHLQQALNDSNSASSAAGIYIFSKEFVHVGTFFYVSLSSRNASPQDIEFSSLSFKFNLQGSRLFHE